MKGFYLGSSALEQIMSPPCVSSYKKSTSAAAVDQLDDMKPEEAIDQEDGDEDGDLDWMIEASLVSLNGDDEVLFLQNFHLIS
ncbi:hypothetical protein BFJ70_g17541 [Fusarium oxysporum]|uniref:Uncharacterized protein n=1 Tax=Fusarium oxysporum TaxID=5507 RepID=A0A420Q2E8_FUSOX|nr:hypothetical protein BFJ68_g17267 [Fusarium oxysporum]RKK98924.1 hypothetical protein BFJ70_g17541 [Fusarium oxysporum]